MVITSKIGKVRSLEYTDIPKVFFTPHHVGCCCTNVIPGQLCNNENPWKDKQTDMDRPITCSLLMLEHEEQLKIVISLLVC
jgi:hypothetical protein